jgi:uncharacterized membrane protein
VAQNRLIRIVLLTCFGVYCFIYPSSVFLLMTDGVPVGTEWMASLMLLLQAGAAISWVMYNYGFWRGLASAASLLVLGFSLETLGVLTGFPFGRYFYTPIMQPQIGVVPIAITAAWVMIVLSSFYTAHYIVRQLWPERGLPTIILAGAALAVISDMMMEPVAVYVQGYWTWVDRGPYYGIPTANFFAWIGTSLIFSLIVVWLTGESGRKRWRDIQSGAGVRQKFSYNFVPLALFLMNVVFFTAINLTHGNLLASAIGFGLGLTSLFLIARVRLASQSLVFSR